MTNDLTKGPCCPSTKLRKLNADQLAYQPIIPRVQIPDDAVYIDQSSSLIGTDSAGIPDDGETPLRTSKVKAFYIGATTVTNAQFREFVDATGYVTEAERFGWSFVFVSQLLENIGLTQAVPGVEWWRRVDGANWRDINGPDSFDTAWHPNHPVVQVSWNDAKAYATWVGGRLPSEAEWEHAARGGLGNVKFPWGNQEPDDTDFQPCNIWQGHFPHTNTAKDGFVTTAPAKHYAPNGYGLYNMVGNVWEWTSDSYLIKSLKKHVRQRLDSMKGFKLSKGGSFMCHKSYCYRYRIAARSGTSPDSAATHQGFRVVWTTDKMKP